MISWVLVPDANPPKKIFFIHIGQSENPVGRVGRIFALY